MPPRRPAFGAAAAVSSRHASSSRAGASAPTTAAKPAMRGAPAQSKVQPKRKPAPKVQRLADAEEEDEEKEEDGGEDGDNDDGGGDDVDADDRSEEGMNHGEADDRAADEADEEEEAADEDEDEEMTEEDRQFAAAEAAAQAAAGARSNDDDNDEELTPADDENEAASEYEEGDAKVNGEEEEADTNDDDEEQHEDDETPAEAADARKSKSPHALVVDTASSAAYAEALAERGVVYLSRIPPYMKAAKLRWLLEQMIPAHKKKRRIGRIFLTPEDESAARRRKKAGGNSGKKFVDGWVEFESKKVARWLAETYNAQPMGGPKRSKYAEDLWTLRYLKGFKWHDLTEKIAYEKQIRATKIREEMSQAKRETEHYIAQVERAQKQQAIQRKRQERKRARGEATDDASEQRPTKQAHLQRNNGEAQPRPAHPQRALIDEGPAGVAARKAKSQKKQ